MASAEKNFKYEIINELGVISAKNNGWRKEFTRVSWNGAEPKYDIRDWSSDRKKMGKGVTLTEEEMRKLCTLLGAEIEMLDN